MNTFLTASDLRGLGAEAVSSALSTAASVFEKAMEATKQKSLSTAYKIEGLPPKPTVPPRPGYVWSWFGSGTKESPFYWVEVKERSPELPTKPLPAGMIWRTRGVGSDEDPYRFVVAYAATGGQVPWYVLHKWYVIGGAALSGLVLLFMGMGARK